MGPPEECQQCGGATLVFDAWAACVVCESCGTVADDICLEEGVTYVNGVSNGVLVSGRDGGASAAWELLKSTGGAPKALTQEAQKENYTNQDDMVKELQRAVNILRLPPEQQQDAEAVLHQVLEGDYGFGKWTQVLAAACSYVAIRRACLPLSMNEVAMAIQVCALAVGTMYRRLIKVLQISLPCVDPAIFIQRAVSNLPPFTGGNEVRGRQVARDAAVLVQFAERRSLVSGRHPLPVAAAALYLAGQSSQAKEGEEVVSVGDICGVVHAGVNATRLRVRELEAAVLEVGQKLPWAALISHRNLAFHLPLLLQMVVALLAQPVGPLRSPAHTTAADHNLRTCPPQRRQGGHQKRPVAGAASASPRLPAAEAPLRPPPPPPADGGGVSVPNHASCSHDLESSSSGKRKKVYRDRRQMSSGAEAAPPSFISNWRLRARRIAKLEAAKRRLAAPSPLDLASFKGLDAEDILIERLLLQGVSKDQVIAGDFRQGTTTDSGSDSIHDDDIQQYIRSSREVDLLRKLSAGT
eukprot:jgi/Mesen1/10927/ME000095S10263